MTTLEVIRDVFAAGGLGLAAWTVYKGVRALILVNDAPIRVKGGSIEVFNRHAEWELDEEDDREYHSKGTSKGWKAIVQKSAADRTGAVTIEGRRLIIVVEVPVGGTEVTYKYKVVFRANGGVRVIDKEKKLVADEQYLRNSSAEHRIISITAKTRGKDDIHVAFGEKDTPLIGLYPTQ